MSPLLRARSRKAGTLERDLELLEQVLATGGDRLDPDDVAAARVVVDRAAQRTNISSGRTVVAVLGATGSGKSSLVNAIAGREIARVAARRPTTRRPLAAVWGADDAGELLDWLDIPDRVQVNRPRERPVGPNGEDLGGLVLVDLPDIDSTEAEHRATAARLAESVDVLLWVLDPQKYADASVHTDFLVPMAEHAEVTLVALNQVDTLTDEELARILADLDRILERDGLHDVQVRPVSARTDEGVEALIGVLAEATEGTRAAHARLRADVRTIAHTLARSAGVDDHAEPATEVPEKAVRRLVGAAAVAAGSQAVAGAVRRSYRRTAGEHVGWPPVRRLARLRPDPVRRLHLGEKNLDPALVRSSVPKATPVQEAAVRSSAHALVTGAAAPLPDRWRAEVHEETQARVPTMIEDLDRTVVATDLENDRRPAWWRVVGFLQWLALAAAIAGLGWLAVLAVLGWLQLPQPQTPFWGPFPAPTVLLAGGILLGLLLWALGSAAARVGADRRGRRVERRIRDAVDAAVREQLVAPLERELGEHARVHDALVSLVRDRR